MAPLSDKQWAILEALDVLGRNGNHSATRNEIRELTGDKGFSKALGQRTKGDPPRDSLEGRGFVECTNPDAKTKFEYKINANGRAALEKHRRGH